MIGARRSLVFVGPQARQDLADSERKDPGDGESRLLIFLSKSFLWWRGC